MLNDVSILITTFWRPGYLRTCLQGIHQNLPECEVCVACDDDNFYSAPTSDRWKILPFDSGLTVKRNAAVALATRKYSLLGCDDYDFSTPEARAGIERMVNVLDAWSDVDVVVGTYNGKAYEGLLEHKPGEYIREHRIKPEGITKIDIGVNYFLARTDVLREVPWDENIRPIGGEHGDWFMMIKQARKRVIFVPGCHITSFTLEGENAIHRDYRKMRNRAWMGHEVMLKKWNIKRWIGFDEQ